MSCTPVWNASTHQYTVDITWTLSGFQLGWISSFRIDRRKSYPGIAHFFDKSETLHPQVSQFTKCGYNSELGISITVYMCVCR